MEVEEVLIIKDKDVDAAYIYLKDISEKEVYRSTKVKEGIYIDFDVMGEMVGIEVLKATKNLKDAYFDFLKNAKKTEKLAGYE